MSANTLHHPVVSKEQWLAERKKLLAREKQLMRSEPVAKAACCAHE